MSTPESHWTQSEIEVLRAKCIKPIEEWSMENIRIPKGGSTIGFSLHEAPYLEKILQDLGKRSVGEVYFSAGPQIGKTVGGLSFLLYTVVEDPSNIFYVMATEDKSKEISDRISKYIEASPVLRNLHLKSTQQCIYFKNGATIFLAYATSATSLSSTDAKYVILDECGKYENVLKGEGDPISLAKQRANSFTYDKKIFAFSTPGDSEQIFSKEISRTEESFTFQALCPHCVKYYKLQDRKIVVEGSKYFYQCDCGSTWSDEVRREALRNGVWVPEKGIDEYYSVHYKVPAICSIFKTMRDVKEAYDKAMSGDRREDHVTYMTQYRAEPYTPRTVNVDMNEIKGLISKEYSRNKPPQEEILYYTMGIDSHKRWFGYVIVGWAVQDERDIGIVVDYGKTETLDGIENALFDGKFKISRAAIDIGGNFDAEGVSIKKKVTSWVNETDKKRGKQGVVFGIKGSSYTSQKECVKKGKEDIRVLDTKLLKDQVHSMIQDRAISLPEDTEQDMIDQLCDEFIDENGNWKSRGKNNHYWDCLIYAYAANHPSWLPNLSETTKAKVSPQYFDWEYE